MITEYVAGWHPRRDGTGDNPVIYQLYQDFKGETRERVVAFPGTFEAAEQYAHWLNKAEDYHRQAAISMLTAVEDD